MYTNGRTNGKCISIATGSSPSRSSPSSLSFVTRGASSSLIFLTRRTYAACPNAGSVLLEKLQLFFLC